MKCFNHDKNPNRVPYFKWFVLQNFPFIEADFDAITNYELYCKIVEYLNKVIAANNNMGTQIETLSSAFTDLQNYVEHYFDTLDIQEEVNNKLDEMAEGGELTELISAYLNLNALICFNTVDDMKEATNAVDGSFFRTYGTENYNDGDGGYYKIRTLINTDVVDGYYLVALDNFPTLVAERIIKKKVKDTILIGDSYGVGYTIVNGQATTVNSWFYWFKNLGGFSNDEIYEFAEGGLGFADPGQGGHTGFQDLLNDNISQISDPKKIKNIIVCGGYNDKNQTFSAIDSAISSFISFCKTNFPNAKVYIGMIANDGNKNQNGVDAKIAIRDTVLIAYQNCRQHGGIYLNGVENITHYYPNFCSDNYHPTEDGYRLLGGNILQAFENGKTSYFLPYQKATITNSAISNFNTFEIGCQMCDDVTNFKITEGKIDLGTPLNMSGAFLIVGNIDFKSYRFTSIPNLVIPTFVGLTTSDNKQYGSLGVLIVNQYNQLAIGFRPYKNDGTAFPSVQNITGIYISSANVSIPTVNT